MIPLARPAESPLRAWLLLLPRAVGAVVVWVLLLLIRAYQVALSPALGPTCRFHPSCSAYAAGSLRRHGAAKGSLLAGWRLLRCNPWNLGGLDPVPSPGRWRPDVLPDGRPREGAGATPPTAPPSAATPVRPVPSLRAES